MSPKRIIEKIKRQSEPNLLDLHVHTTISDGLLSPEEIVKTAYRMKYKILGITDHDSLSGIDRARAAAVNYGLEIIPGCELTSYYYKSEIHILGYFIEPNNNVFNDYLKKFKETRHDRAREMVKKLNKLGIKIDFQEMIKNVNSEALGRPHIAREIVKKGFASDVQSAFENYLLPGSPAYVPKFSINPKEIIQLILKAGGVPVFAHPYYYFNFEAIIQKLISYGLKGIEVYHSFHTPVLARKFKKTAEKYGLIITGGSDAHSEPNGDYLPFGKVGLKKSIIHALREERDKIREENNRSVKEKIEHHLKKMVIA